MPSTSIACSQGDSGALAALEQDFQQLALSDESTGTCRCHFFGLPRELRDNIYSELWRLTPTIHLEKSRCYYACGARYSHDPGQDSASKGLPLWILCSKTLFHEAMEHFNLYARWQLSTNHPIIGHYNGCSRLIGLSHARNLEIKTESRIRSARSANGQIEYSLSRLNKHRLPPFIRLLGPSLRVLTFKFTHYLFTDPATTPEVVPFVPIAILEKTNTRFETIHLHLDLSGLGYSPVKVDFAAVAPQLTEAYENELRRVGALMGGDAASDVDDAAVEAAWQCRWRGRFELKMKYSRTGGR